MAENAELTETIKQEGGKFVLYSKDGSKKLGEHPSKEKAQAQEAALEAAKAKKAKGENEGLGVGLVKHADGSVALEEGGRYVLNEDAGDMARMEDDELRGLRKVFVEKRTALRQAQQELDQTQKYGSPEGSALWDDISYYGMLISRLECEMACRMMTLD